MNRFKTTKFIVCARRTKTGHSTVQDEALAEAEQGVLPELYKAGHSCGSVC